MQSEQRDGDGVESHIDYHHTENVHEDSSENLRAHPSTHKMFMFCTEIRTLIQCKFNINKTFIMIINY